MRTSMPLLLIASIASVALCACSGASATDDDDDPRNGATSGATSTANANTSGDTSNNGTTHNGAAVAEPTPNGVVINEVAASGDPSDWVELCNTTDAPVDVSGYTLTDDIAGGPGDTPLGEGTVIEAGGYLVLDLNDDTFGFKISSDEELALFDAAGVLLDAADWDEGGSPEGGAFARLPDGTGSFQTISSPTPGAPNEAGDAPEEGVLIINEVVASGDPSDWVELHNGTFSDIDLGGYTLTDDIAGDPSKAVLPEGTVIEAGAYLVLEINDDTLGFKIGGDEELALFDPGGELVDAVDWDEGDSPEGGAFARLPDVTGAFQTTGSPTREAPNEAGPVPEEGALVLNEIAAAGDPSDWVELYNGTFSNIDLSGYALTDDIAGDPSKAVLPEGTVIEAGAYLVLEINDDTLGFKISGDEELGLFDPDGELVDAADWDEGDSPEGGSFARLPDGVGDFEMTPAATRDAPNE